jgi:hypothetical protein
VIRELIELTRASANLLVAKLRASECPPHEYDDRFEFCLRCGEYRTYGSS